MRTPAKQYAKFCEAILSVYHGPGYDDSHLSRPNIVRAFRRLAWRAEKLGDIHTTHGALQLADIWGTGENKPCVH